MKIHYAGTDNERCDNLIADVGIKYRLSTYYYLRKKPWPKLRALNRFTHLIIDSGLFTMMFGSDSKTKVTEQAIREWLDSYIAFINRSFFINADFVECDVQKVLSPELAWELRQYMKAGINKGNVINVYHLEDGNPDKLISYSDYIAISLPELRNHLSDRERYELTKYIAVKATLAGKRVHLLGCTEEKYMRDFSFCYSADSTSWYCPLRYGEIKSELINVKYNTVKTNLDDDIQMLAVLYQDEYRLQTNSQL